MKRTRLESKKVFVATALASKKKSDNVSNFGTGLGDFQDMQEAMESIIPTTVDTKPRLVKKPINKRIQKGAPKRNQKIKMDQLDVERYNTLMNIPDFASDPLAAMEKHLLHQKRVREEKEARKMSQSMDVSL